MEKECFGRLSNLFVITSWTTLLPSVRIMHRCRGSTTWRIPMALSHGGIYALQPLKFTVVHRLGGGGDIFCWFWWVRLGWIAPWPKLGGGGVWWGVAGEEGWSSGSRVWCQGQAGCHCWWTSSTQPFPILVAARDGERRSRSSWSSDDRSRNVKQTVNHWVRGFWKVTKKQLWLCRLRQEWKIKAKVHEDKNESCLSFHNIIIFFQVLTTRKHHKLLTLLKETQIWSHAKIILIIKEKKSCIRYMPKAAHAIFVGFHRDSILVYPINLPKQVIVFLGWLKYRDWDSCPVWILW